MALEGLAFGSGAETIAATRAGWESLGDEHLAGLAAENVVVGDASGRLEAQRLALASLRLGPRRPRPPRRRPRPRPRRRPAPRGHVPDAGEEAELALWNVEMALDLAGGELGGSTWPASPSSHPTRVAPRPTSAASPSPSCRAAASAP